VQCLGTVGSDLTRRESEILELLRTGASTPSIAATQYLSVHTVRNHVRKVLMKLDAHSKLEAVAIANREGLFAC
jgi:DNA-binding CsgD family transcriptional regulator